MVSEYLSYPDIVAIFAFLLVVCVFIRALFFRKQTDRLSDDLRLTQQELAIALADLEVSQRKHTVNLGFQDDLQNAELTMKLQQPRLSAQYGNRSTTTPERYLYVRSLAEKGMSAEEIASILKISIHEAQQLVNLSKLAIVSQ